VDFGCQSFGGFQRCRLSSISWPLDLRLIPAAAAATVVVIVVVAVVVAAATLRCTSLSSRPPRDPHPTERAANERTRVSA